MKTLKELMILKNLRTQDVSEITGYGIRMIEIFMAEQKPTPKLLLDIVELEPDRPSNGMMRRNFLAILAELGITWQQAATILKKHANRMEKIADHKRNMNQRVAITEENIRRLREYSKT